MLGFLIWKWTFERIGSNASKGRLWTLVALPECHGIGG
jgi:hypothetical protein